MTYQELLLNTKWKEKRVNILKRESYTCQDCFNQEYQQNFESGLIMSNKLKHGTVKSSIINKKFIVKIWDIKRNVIETAFLELDSSFDSNKSYIAYYETSSNYANIFALKLIDSSKIELNNNVLEITKNGIRGKFTENTQILISAPILKSDKWQFVKGLHVHHSYYQHDLFPWEYPDNSLSVLCWSCHEKRHKNSTIPVYKSDGSQQGVLTYCLRCHGAGIFPEYKHVQSGICFRCHGARYEELIN